MAESQGERILGQYRLIEQIGVGGMGVVYRAVHLRLGRQSAVKVLPETLAADPTFRLRFEREAANAAALHHNNILDVWDYGEEGGVTYLVMPYITGGTLRQRLANGPLRPQEALGYIRQIADALDFAHSKGIIHRDVKPANLLLDERGQLYLADFGIAKALEGSEGLTRTGVGVGTPEYMAPEQARGQADHRSDLYALGVILYQMLTGQVPFSGNSTVEVLMKHLQDPLPMVPLRGVQPNLPQGVEAVVQKALAKNPNDRFQSGKALTDALAEALADRPTGGIPTYVPGNTPLPPAAIPPGMTPPPRPDQPTSYAQTVQYGTTPPPLSQTGPGQPYVPPMSSQQPMQQLPQPPMHTPALMHTPPPMPGQQSAQGYPYQQYQTPIPNQIPVPPQPPVGGTTGTTGGGSGSRVLIAALAAVVVVLLICLSGLGAYALFRDTTTPTPVPTVNAAGTATASTAAANVVRATQTAGALALLPSPSPTATQTATPPPTLTPTPTRTPSPSPSPTPTSRPTPTATRTPAVSKAPIGSPPAAGWKTYSGHAKVPFAIYYPPDWTIDEKDAANGLIYIRPPGAGGTWMLIATTGVPVQNGNIDVLRDQYYNNTLAECKQKAIDRTNYTEYSGITFAGLGATCDTDSGLYYARIGLGLNNQVPWRYRLNATYGEYSDKLDQYYSPMLASLNIYQNP